MCGTCGCGEHHHHHDHTHEHSHGHEHHHHPDEGIVINLEQDILQRNNLLAERNRGYFEAKNLFCLNLMSSPGSGKTTLLEETSRRYEEIEEKIKRLKTPMDSLQMTLSFMGLLVIPSLKLSNKGLFNSETFQFTSLLV